MLCGQTEGAAENISPLVGAHQLSHTLSILFAFGLQHTLFLMPKKIHLESKPAPLGKQKLVQLPCK